MLISLMRVAKRCKKEDAAMLATSRATISAFLEVAPMDRELPSPEFLRKILAYNPDTGELRWLERGEDVEPRAYTRGTFNNQFSGKVAFTANANGYRVGRILDVLYKAHRVAWAIHYGEWPSERIDHINGDKSDNRIANLRVVNASGNAKNSKKMSNNTSGVTGVSWYRAYGKWHASIQNEKKPYFLGYFDKIEDAIAARKKAEDDFGFHPNHGRQA